MMAKMDLFSPSCRLQEAGKEVVGVNRDTPRKYNVVVVLNPTLGRSMPSRSPMPRGMSMPRGPRMPGDFRTLRGEPMPQDLWVQHDPWMRATRWCRATSGCLSTCYNQLTKVHTDILSPNLPFLNWPKLQGDPEKHENMLIFVQVLYPNEELL